MDRAFLEARLAQTQQQRMGALQQQLLLERSLEDLTARIHTLHGREVELGDLIALMPATPAVAVPPPDVPPPAGEGT